MKEEKRHELYEKLYFHEVDAKDKVVSRLQIPLALLFSVLSILAVLVKGVSAVDFECWHLFFYVFFVVSVVLFGLSTAYFVGAFYNHGYSFMPPSSEIEDYRATLIKHYAPYEDADENVEREFTDFIYNNFNQCASKNIVVNDLRSRRIHMCNRYLLFTVGPLLLAFLIFTFSGMGSGSDKAYKVELSKPISILNLENPIKIQGELNSTTLEVDFSNDVKEMISVRREKERAATATATTTTP
jgi:hypothetical protein